MKLSDEDNEKIDSQYRRHRIKLLALYLPIPLVHAFNEEADLAALARDASEDEANGRAAPVKLKHTEPDSPKQNIEDEFPGLFDDPKKMEDLIKPFLIEVFEPKAASKALLAKEALCDDKTRRMEDILQWAKDYDGQRSLIATPIKTIVERFNRLAIEMPNFKGVIDSLLCELTIALAGDSKDFRVMPLCLNGPPGVGKTRFAREVAKILEVGFEQISLGSSTGSFDLAGLSPGWSTTRAGKISTLLAEGKSACPVILLDEIDKLGGDARYNAANVLLDLLEKDTAAAFLDEGLELRFDASRIVFMATSNDAAKLSEPLKSRMRMIEVCEPSIEQRRVIVGNMAHEYKRLNVSFAADTLDAMADLDLDLRSVYRLARDLVGKTLMEGKKKVTTRHIPARPAAKQGMGFL